MKKNNTEIIDVSLEDHRLQPVIVEDSEYSLSFPMSEPSPISAPSSSPRDTHPVAPVASPLSNIALIAMKELLFPEGTKVISDHCTFDPIVRYDE